MDYTIEFAYSEPHWGTIVVDGLAADVPLDEVQYEAIKQIEMSYPEAYDIEITKVTKSEI